MLGKWIDSLSDAARDKIIKHPDPTYTGERWRSGDCGCLVGCTVAEDDWEDVGGLPVPRSLYERGELQEDRPGAREGLRFPQLTERFGAERIWRAAKMRAAKRNRVEIPETVPPL